MKNVKAALAVFFAISVLSMALVGRANAALVADWSFDQTDFTVGQSDSIELWATFTNDASSTQDLDGGLASIIGIFTGTVGGPTDRPYKVDFGSSLATLSGMYLAPGESFNWLFATLQPVFGPVAPGTYSTLGADVTIDEREYGGFRQNIINVTVVADAVPAPAAGLLMILGLIGIWGKRRKA